MKYNKINSIYGFHAVESAILNNPKGVKKVFLEKGRRDKRMEDLKKLLKENKISFVLEKRKFFSNDKSQGVMAEYESESSGELRKELLKKAKNILIKLIEQANNVESEISIIAKKKLGKLYSKKLDRVLSSVLQMREVAERKMQAAGQAS